MSPNVSFLKEAATSTPNGSFDNENSGSSQNESALDDSDVTVVRNSSSASSSSVLSNEFTEAFDTQDESEWEPSDAIDKRVLNEGSEDIQDRPKRNSIDKPRQNYAEFAFAFVTCDPLPFKQAISSDNSIQWKNAMQEEFDSLQSNQT